MGGFRWNAFQELVAIQEKMNRLFEETIYRREFSEEPLSSSSHWCPAADAYESPGCLVFHAEIPGVALEDVKLEADGGVLRLSGTRRQGNGSGHYLRMERVYGDFVREFPLPRDIDPNGIAASLEAGVLTITVNRAGGHGESA